MMDDLVVLYTTWPDADTAQAAGRAAVEGRLAACANILAPMRSIYAWDGAVQDEAETPMLLKTTAGAVERLKDFIVQAHPYDTPCVIALQTLPRGCHAGYADWAEQRIS